MAIIEANGVLAPTTGQCLEASGQVRGEDADLASPQAGEREGIDRGGKELRERPAVLGDGGRVR